MLPTILTVEFGERDRIHIDGKSGEKTVEHKDIWVIRLRHPDGREATARFTPDAFSRIRECPMGQFLLHAWLARAAPVEVQQPNPPR